MPPDICVSVSLSRAQKNIQAIADLPVSDGPGATGHQGIRDDRYGDYTTMAGLTELPETFGAAADIFGIGSFETYSVQRTLWIGAIRAGECTTLDVKRQLLGNLPPVHKLDHVQTPLQAMHRANDTNVAAAGAVTTVQPRAERGFPVMRALFPDERQTWQKEFDQAHYPQPFSFFRPNLWAPLLLPLRISKETHRLDSICTRYLRLGLAHKKSKMTPVAY